MGRYINNLNASQFNKNKFFFNPQITLQSPHSLLNTQPFAKKMMISSEIVYVNQLFFTIRYCMQMDNFFGTTTTLMGVSKPQNNAEFFRITESLSALSRIMWLSIATHSSGVASQIGCDHNPREHYYITYTFLAAAKTPHFYFYIKEEYVVRCNNDKTCSDNI